nr:MAG TPA: hypothetical protein [Caudoviricetes sp.]
MTSYFLLRKPLELYSSVEPILLNKVNAGYSAIPLGEIDTSGELIQENLVLFCIQLSKFSWNLSNLRLLTLTSILAFSGEVK